MPLYEHVFLARQDVSQSQVETMAQDYKTIIEDAGGSISKTEYWGVKSLTYKIKKNRKAHFMLLNLDCDPAAKAEMERRMGLSNDVLRFLTIRVDEHETEPSAMMRRDDRRGGRGGDGFRRGGGPRGGGRDDRGPRGGGGRDERGPPRGGREERRPATAEQAPQAASATEAGS